MLSIFYFFFFTDNDFLAFEFKKRYHVVFLLQLIDEYVLPPRVSSLPRNLPLCNLNMYIQIRKRIMRWGGEELADMCQLQYLYSEFILLTSLEILEKFGASVKTDLRQFQLT